MARRLNRACNDERRNYFQKAMSIRIAEYFKGATVDILPVKAPLSGYYAYMRVHTVGYSTIVVSVNECECTVTIERILSHALLCKGIHDPDDASELVIVLPGTAPKAVVSKLQSRMRCLKTSVRLLFFSYYLVDIDEAPTANLSDDDVPSEVVPLMTRQSYIGALAEKQKGLFWDIIAEVERTAANIDSHYLPLYVSFRINGLEVAKLTTPKDTRNWRLHLGVGAKKKPYPATTTPLPAGTNEALTTLIQQVASRRRPDGNKRATYYRLQSEHWLESSVRKKPSMLDPTFIAVHTQVPTSLVTRVVGKNSYQRIDALALSSSGQLSVVELKVKPDIEAVFQALDYWIWAEQHKQHLQKQGYFRGHHIDCNKTVGIVVAAPVGAFHPELRGLFAAIKPEVPCRVLELKNDWRNHSDAAL